MHVQRTLSRSVGMLAVTAILGATACGPIGFSDASALAIEGTPPVVEAPPPPEPPKRVEVRDNRIVINEKIQFEFDSAKILSVSHDLLNEVAQTIKDNPHIKKIEIQGHASSEGADKHNLDLSDRRAKAVMKYLTGDAGVEVDRLTAKGYGETQPIADNETDVGREKNRRVEFVITEQEITQEKVEIGPEGEEKVVSTETVTD